MVVPDKAQRLGLPFLAAACVLFSVGFAEASIQEELNEMTSLADMGNVERKDVPLSSHVVASAPVLTSLHGARERKQARYANWPQLLGGDRKLAFEQYGWPTHRFRIDSTGEVTEHWIYDASQKQLIFRGNRLIETR